MNLLYTSILSSLSISMLGANILSVFGSFFELLKMIITTPLRIIKFIGTTISQAQFFLGRLIATNFGVFLAVIMLIVLAMYAVYYIVIKKRFEKK